MGPEVQTGADADRRCRHPAKWYYKLKAAYLTFGPNRTPAGPSAERPRHTSVEKLNRLVCRARDEASSSGGSCHDWLVQQRHGPTNLPGSEQRDDIACLQADVFRRIDCVT